MFPHDHKVEPEPKEGVIAETSTDRELRNYYSAFTLDTSAAGPVQIGFLQGITFAAAVREVQGK